MIMRVTFNKRKPIINLKEMNTSLLCNKTLYYYDRNGAVHQVHKRHNITIYIEKALFVQQNTHTNDV